MEPTAKLEYAHPQAPSWRRRLWWLTPLALIAAFATIYLIQTWLIPTLERWQDVRKQKLLLEYRAPADQVVFENDPTEAAKLIARSPDYRLEQFPAHPNVAGAVHLPPEWRSRPAGIGSMGSSDGIVFLHARTSPGGNQRLVVVQCNAGRRPIMSRPESFLPTVEFGVHAVRLGTLRQPPANARSSSTGEVELNTTRFRLFAGQPDPADSSHFTIDYEADRVRGTIDGWLQDDDTIILKPRAPIAGFVYWNR
jgi:hypothetical protein